MRLNTRKILKSYQFTNLGVGTTNVDIPIYDISHGLSMTAILTLTKARLDGTDTIDILIQETLDHTIYNTRGRFGKSPGVLLDGTLNPSAAAPDVRELNILAEYTPLSTTEQAYSWSGSADGTELAIGSVRNGPFVGPVRSAAAVAPMGLGTWLPAYRVRIVVVSGNAASFSGQIDVLLNSYS